MTNSLRSTRSIAYVSMFAALIAVFGLIPKIDLPLGVPITLQTLGVMLAGCLLGPRLALQSLALMLEISPDYFASFVSYADTLLCLERRETTRKAARKP